MIVQTNLLVGREVAKPNIGGPSKGIRSESDESILARAKTDFVRSTITSIENWVSSIGNPDLIIRHGPRSEHFIRLRGRTQIYYYYAQNWLYGMLYNATTTETHELRSRLSKPEQVIETSPGYVRFHIADEGDLETMKQLIHDRVEITSGT